MSSEHVEVLERLRDRWAVPDERVALDAAIAALSAPQPPAEAQAQGGGEEGFKAWVVEQMPAGTVIGNPAWWADRLAQAYAFNVPAPPSAPVGVEGFPPDVQEIIRRDEAAWALAERAEAAGAERDSDDNETWWTLRIEQFYALAQQPAAVDDAMVRRALCMWFGDPSGNGLDRGVPAVEEWFKRMKAALTAALATQPEGPDNDR